MNKEIRILLVDDESDFTESMSFWFKSKGYSVTSVSNGKDALKTIKENPPDIVFLDIIMPNIDGLAVLKMIREFNKTLPVIMMSAYLQGSEGEREEDLRGSSGVFYKDEGFSKALALLESALSTDEKLKDE